MWRSVFGQQKVSARNSSLTVLPPAGDGAIRGTEVGRLCHTREKSNLEDTREPDKASCDFVSSQKSIPAKDRNAHLDPVQELGRIAHVRLREDGVDHKVPAIGVSVSARSKIARERQDGVAPVVSHDRTSLHLAHTQSRLLAAHLLQICVPEIEQNVRSTSRRSARLVIS
jgi:hypothetical protein